MQLSKFVILNITALLFSTGEACKCYGTKGNLNNGATHKCCNITMVGFDRCCKGQGSDCDVPGRAAALGQEMRAVKHVEIKTALAK
ncbi:uncharacterized protein FPRO_10037 [Fusarium proliferatum ET1]|uniref:Uncharacterized protein n=1 Tax=Fusarium proliferatum (strain ET1) TaxID=1227346 RepID=A0A1L7VQL4_FUSPR|nr:uncharacterized protein FPRO_10037 [Fusarium proliferatum ET1]CZR42734.1 uncharacterized protein FPRO_10037 [Fusarium proliferatum ET1]